MSSVLKDDPARGSVTVVVRVRGQNAKELGMPIVTKVIDDKVVVFDPKPDTAPDYFYGKKKQFRDLNKRQNKNAIFQFDRVFDETCSSVDIFETATKDVIIDVLNGYNACVFAYGATGAGKTFTMLGTAEAPGVTFLGVMSLYERIGHITDKTYDIAASYLEVYNEQIRDLLVPGGPLALREDSCGDVVAAGLSLHKINSADELLQMLDFGNKNRTQHPTDANAESSRSHAVFQVYVKQRDRTANTTANIKVGKLSLIDLAGSERATVTTNRGARFREGANINRSLLALGNCINALADGKSKGYVPYRNSKLTRLLKDSLGGNCRTVMIAAISPSSLSYEDTYNTLRYANRAKEIKVDLKQNNLSIEYHISQYPKMIQELRDQVSELKDKLSEYENGNSDKIVPLTEKPSSFICMENENRFKEALQTIFDQRVSIRKELMELEGSEKVLGLKILKKEITLNRLSLLVEESCHDKTIGELQRSISAARHRVNKISVLKAALERKMSDNAVELDRVETEIKSTLPAAAESLSRLLEFVLQCRHLEVELRDSRQQVKYLKKISRIQQREAIASEKLVSTLLKFARYNHYVLKGHGLATIESTNEFACIQRLLRGSSEVVWQDSTEAHSKDGLNGVSFERLLHFPTLGYKLTPPGQSACPTYKTLRSDEREVLTVEPRIVHPPSSVKKCPLRINSSISVTTDDDSDRDSDDGDNSINNATFTLTSSKHLGLPTSFSGTPATSVVPDPLRSSQNSPFCPSVFIGKLTFSETAKPAMTASTARSPLKSCHNVMQAQTSTVSRKRSAPSQEMSHFAKTVPVCDGPALNSDKSHRLITDAFTLTKPSYMQMTRAASHRQQNLPSVRSTSIDDAKRARYQAPGRVPLPQFSKPSRIRSSSTTSHFVLSSSSNQRKGIMF